MPGTLLIERRGRTIAEARRAAMHAHVGDRLIVEGDRARTGLIIGVPHPDGTPPYIVKWLADGHVAMVSPDAFARIVPAEREPDPAPAIHRP